MSTILDALRKVEGRDAGAAPPPALDGDFLARPGEPLERPPRPRSLPALLALGLALVLGAGATAAWLAHRPAGSAEPAPSQRAPVAAAPALPVPPAGAPPAATRPAPGAAMAQGPSAPASALAPAAAPLAPGPAQQVAEDLLPGMPPPGDDEEPAGYLGSPPPSPVPAPAAVVRAAPAATATAALSPATSAAVPAAAPPKPAPVAVAAKRSPAPAAAKPKPKPTPRRRPAREPDVAVIPPPPRVEVERTIWHPHADRRVATLRIEGRGEPLDVHEGDAVGVYVVKEIQPSAVIFVHDGRTVRRRVGGGS